MTEQTTNQPDADTDYPIVDIADVIALYANVDGTGGTLSGKPVYTIDQVVANLNRTSYPGTGIPGPQWSYGENFMGQNKSGDPKVIQYGYYETRSELFQVPYVFPQGAGLAGRNEYFQFAPFSAAQRAATDKALALWDDLIDVSIVKVSNINDADITYGNLASAPSTQAYAYLPYNYSGNSAGLQGDVWVSLSQASNLQLGNGFYGLATLIHETGHALGLQHPGAYNAAPGVSITYAGNAEYYQDTRMYSQMSYFNAEFSGGGHIDWNRLNWVYGQTPLLHDIATIQAMYGADPTTRVTDTVYGFNSTAGREVFDFSTNTMPVISIYDAGGIDTLDFSGWNSNSKIDLNPGAFSDGGGSGLIPLDVLKARGLLPASYTEEQYTALRARYNALDGMLHQNISIAYGTIIENATGGGGDDVIIGNDVDNILLGNAGVDLIEGRLGNDTLNGGLGADAMWGGLGNDSYVVDDALDLVTELAGEGTDSVSSSISYTLTDNVENLVLTGSALNGTGNALDNAITGNELGNTLLGGLGNDTLTGLGGDDTLDGGLGADAMTGGTGNDTYVVDDAGDTVSELAGEGTDTVRSSLSYTLGANIENLILSGLAADGTGNELDNAITGNELANRLNGGLGNDSLSGMGGNDVLDGGAGADAMTGGAGDDFYFVDQSGDTASELAGEGTDTVSSAVSYTLGANVENLFLTGTAANGTGNGLDNLFKGNAAANRFDGGLGTDTVSYAGAGAGVAASLLIGFGLIGEAQGDRYVSIERLEGSNFNDALTGGIGNDTLLGLDGDDALAGLSGNDSISGGGGRDAISGGSGADSIDGGAGDDWLYGNEDNDTILGGLGNDTLSGDDGDDRIDGGAGNDQLSGGDGRDIFAFTELGGKDEILDFRKGQDKIDLSHLDANSSHDGLDAFSWIGKGAFTGHAGELRSYSVGHDYFVAGDTDGDRIADFVIQTNTQIVQTDILFV
jgi:serralysin